MYYVVLLNSDDITCNSHHDVLYLFDVKATTTDYNNHENHSSFEIHGPLLLTDASFNV